MCVPWYVYGGQRTTSGSLFSPSSMWVLGLEFRFSDSVESTFTYTFTYWVTWLSQESLFYVKKECFIACSPLFFNVGRNKNKMYQNVGNDYLGLSFLSPLLSVYTCLFC